jgi:K+-sensing histidine kinase KdpD
MMEALETHTEHVETERSQPEPESLPHSIAAAGLQVSQAADELREAVERLVRAERLALEAEERARTAEEQLEQGATKNAELLEMLQQAREGQTEADERRRTAEERLGQAEAQLREAETRARTAEERLELIAAQNAELLSLVERAQESQADGAEEARQVQERLAAETERAEALERRVAELEARLGEAETAQRVTVIVGDEERSLLKESVAAEVRRPLTSILGLALALKHVDASSSDGKDMVKQLATSARKLDRLVGQMLDLDKLAAGTLVPNRRRTNLEALVRRVVEESQELEGRDVRIEADRVAMAVDPHLAEQMIDALLANAAKRTAPGNPVWVRVSPDEGGAVIAVDDTSSEVPKGLRSAMFAALGDDQEGSGPASTGETGLGLLARLAEIHGGRAWVQERQGGGASFRVLLSDGGAEPAGEGARPTLTLVADPDETPADVAHDTGGEPTETEAEAETDALGKLLTS